MQQLPFISFAYYYSRSVFDLTFRSGSCGRIFVRSRPKALLKIDERKIRQTKFAGSSAHAAYDTVSG